MLQVIVIALLLDFPLLNLVRKNIGIVKACNNINENFHEMYGDDSEIVSNRCILSALSGSCK